MGDLIDDRDSPTWAYDLALRLEPGNAVPVPWPPG